MDLGALAWKHKISIAIVAIGFIIMTLNPAGALAILFGIAQFIYKEHKDSKNANKLVSLATELEKEKQKSEKLNEEKNHYSALISKVKEDLERKEISIQMLVEKFNKPLYTIILQKYNEAAGKLIVKKLYSLGFVSSGQGIYLLKPLKAIELGIDNNTNITKWVQDNLLANLPNNYKYIIKFACIVDLRNVSTFTKIVIHAKTVFDKLDIADIMTLKDFFANTKSIISIKEIIENTDITFLIDACITEAERDALRQNSSQILKTLLPAKNRSMLNLATQDIMTISSQLNSYCSEPDKVATNILNNAIFWKRFF